MAKCKQCRNVDECQFDAACNNAVFDPECSAKYCTGFECLTNADRIRAMSDEELADYLAELGSEANNGVIYSDRPEEWLEWLKQPAEVKE